MLKSIKQETVHGTIIGVSGNFKALNKDQRYLYKDLNRLRTK